MIFAKARLILAAAVLAAFALSNLAVGWKAYQMGQDNIQVKWDKAVSKDVDRKLDVKAIQDEIQNAPVDTGITVRRMRRSTW